MKTTTRIVLLVLAFYIYSCKEHLPQNTFSVTPAITFENDSIAYDAKQVADSLQMDSAFRAEREGLPGNGGYKLTETEIDERDQAMRDSKVILKRVFPAAIGYVRRYGVTRTVNYTNDTFELKYGHIFNDSDFHLLVKVNTYEKLIVRVYRYVNDEFKKVAEYVNESPMSHQDESIKDVNGDKRKDLLAHYYPSSGCCLRDVYMIYLQRPDGTFTNEVQLINPVFSPKEKLVRGLEYGQPEETPYYKYAWNGYRLDTVEFIYPHFDASVISRRHLLRNDTTYYLRTKKYESTEGERLKEIPKEYENVGYGNKDN